MKKGMLFEAVAVLLLIILVFVLYLMVTTSGQSDVSRQANYAGAAKLVLQITGEEGHYNVTVLYSNNTSVSIGDHCWLFINQPLSEGWSTLLTPSQLTTDTIIGINDYGLAVGDNKVHLPDQIDVTVSMGTEWTAKIKILG